MHLGSSKLRLTSRQGTFAPELVTKMLQKWIVLEKDLSSNLIVTFFRSLNVMLGMILNAKVDIPREEAVLSVTFFDRFLTRISVIDDRVCDRVWLVWNDNVGHIDRMMIQQKVNMKNALSSIVILTLLLTKPVGTVMDKASVFEVFKYRSPWL